MRYYIKEVSKSCVLEFNRYVVCSGIDTKYYRSSELYQMFCFTMKSVLDLEVSEFNGLIEQYGEQCVLYVRNRVKELQRISRCNIEDRSNLYAYCNYVYVCSDVVFESYKEEFL